MMADREALLKNFGDTVRRLRTERRLSQEYFAQMSGVHRTYMGIIERGEKAVSIVKAEEIAEALGMTLADLFKELERGTGRPGT